MPLAGPGIVIAEPVATVGAALILIAVTTANATTVPWLLNLPPLVRIGRRSYATYLVQIDHGRSVSGPDRITSG